MQRKDAIILLVLALGGAYAIRTNWTTIREKLGLDDLQPGHIKAMQLAKNARTFDTYSPNWTALRDREASGEIKVAGDPWHSTEIGNLRFRVTCTFVEKGERRVHRFQVDTASGTVTYEGLDEGKPAPR